MTGCIIGWAHSKFGKLERDELESLIVQVTVDALHDAHIHPKDVDAIFIGQINGGLEKQLFPSSLVLQADNALRYTPSTRVENACATGTAAIHQGLNYIEAKKGRIVLVVGVEKMTKADSKTVGDCLIRASYLPEEGNVEGGFAGIFGQIAEQYFQRYGNQTDAMARIAVKNHKNGCLNPYAHMHKEFDFDFCRAESDKNPSVAGPLKRTDCSLISDGAAAVVLADLNTALSCEKAVIFRAAQQVNDFLPMSKRNMTQLEGANLAWQNAYDEANITLNDLSLVETHDCFTIAELMEYEAMGLTEFGQEQKLLMKGGQKEKVVFRLIYLEV